MTPITELQESDMKKYPTCAVHGTTSPKFSSILLYDCHERYMPVFPHGVKCTHKVLFESCGRSTVFKFPAAYGPVLTKFSKYDKIFKFWQIAGKNNRLYS